MAAFGDAGRAIEQNLEALKKPGILAVRPGYRIEAGWPVGEMVVVALVGAKQGEAAAYGLPSQIGGVPIEVPRRLVTVTNGRARVPDTRRNATGH